MTAIGTSDELLAGESAMRGADLSCRLESLPWPCSSVTVLSLFGEIDTCTQSTAETALDAALDHAPGPAVIDLSGLTFCSACGFGLLGAPTGTVAGHSYVLAGMTPHLQRAAAVLWRREHPTCYPHTAAAVTALRAARVSPSSGAEAA